jgi:hypothetical protein
VVYINNREALLIEIFGQTTRFIKVRVAVICFDVASPVYFAHSSLAAQGDDFVGLKLRRISDTVRPTFWRRIIALSLVSGATRREDPTRNPARTPLRLRC